MASGECLKAERIAQQASNETLFVCIGLVQNGDDHNPEPKHGFKEIAKAHLESGSFGRKLIGKGLWVGEFLAQN